MNISPLFDHNILELRARRALNNLAQHDFMLRHVTDEFSFRLSAIQRRFPVVVEFGIFPARLARMLQTQYPDAFVVTSSCGVETLSDPDAPLTPGMDHGAKVVNLLDAVPFGSGVANLIVSPLALHFANDLPGALIQIRRALAPDGLFLAAVVGGDTLRELREAFLAADVELSGGASPRVMPMADVRDYGALLQRAGFALPVTDSERVDVTYRDALALMHDLRGMAATNMLTERSRKPLRRATLTRAAEIYAERFPAHDGRVRATFEIVYLTGWAPHDSQQKPAAPGSATARLADALNTVETSAGDKAGFKPAVDPAGAREDPAGSE